jgi:microcystin-dependent protein
MAEPFLGELRIVSFNFAPRGWALCNGQLLPINQNQALFSLLGTMYGGDGRVTFALPNLRGRVPVHVGPEISLQGTSGGEEAHTLTVSELPRHGHAAGSNMQASTGNPVGAFPSVKRRFGPNAYAGPGGNVMLLGQGTVGGSQPHSNMQPYLALNVVIALQGIFPSQI